MKRSLFLFVLLVVAAPAWAQGPAVHEFEVDGVPVILGQVPDTPVVGIGLFLRGGSCATTPALAGLDQLALTAAIQGGTRTIPKEEFHRALEALGSELSATAYADLSQITVRAVRPNLEATWDLVASLLAGPAFPEADLELARRQQLAMLRMEDESPDGLLRRLAEERFFEGHPYAIRPLGRPETVAGFTRAQVSEDWARLLTRSRLLVVVVGDVDRPTVESLLRRSTSRLPGGTRVPDGAPPLPTSRGPVVLEAKELPTWFVRGTFAAPAPGTPDYAPAMVAAEALSDRLFREVRTRRNLVYSIFSAMSGREANYGLLYFTSTNPAEVMEVVREEVRRLQATPLEAGDLQAEIEVFLTGRWMSEASATDQVLRLGHAEIVAGDWRKADEFAEAVERVTPAQVQEAARKYFRDLEFVVLGPEKGLDPSTIRL